MKYSLSPLPLKNNLSDPDSPSPPENYLPDLDLWSPPEKYLSDLDNSAMKNYLSERLEYSLADLDLSSQLENYLSDLDSPLPLENNLSDPDSPSPPENYLPDLDLWSPPEKYLSDLDNSAMKNYLSERLENSLADLDLPSQLENYLSDLDSPLPLENNLSDLDSISPPPLENYSPNLYDWPSPQYLSDLDLIMKHSLTPPSVKKELSELESIQKPLLSSCNTMKRKFHSESNDEKKKKKKPGLKVNGSSQSSNLDDIKPENLNSGESSRSLCGICFDLKTDSDMFKRKSCNHLFCIDCISKYVDSQINSNVVKVICPGPNCYVKLKPKHLQSIVSRDFIDRWESLKYESKIALEQKTYCPFENCSILLVNDNSGGEAVVTSCECPYCHRLFCAQCKVPWHAEMNCQEFQNLKVHKHEQDLDDKFFKLAEKEQWQRCPDCSFYVKRSHGCEHMKCRCKCNFCYHCGKKWEIGHLCNGVYS